MDDHYAMLKDHQDIKDLPVLAVITDAKAAIAKVRTLKSTIDALSVPMAFKHELEAVEEALSEFQPKFAHLIDYKEQLMTTVAKVQKQEADIITALNNQKIKFKERLEAKGIPSSVSSPMASTVAKWANGDMTRGIFCGTFDALWPVDSSVEDVGERLQCVRYFPKPDSKVPDPQSHIEKELHSLVTDLMEPMKQKVCDLMATVAHKKGDHGLSLLPMRQFKWVEDESKQSGINFPPGMDQLDKIIVHASNPEIMDNRREVYPWGGLGSMITVTGGSWLILVLQEDQVQCAGTGDLNLYLRNLANTALINHPCLVLCADESVYIPFGCRPVFSASWDPAKITLACSTICASASAGNYQRPSRYAARPRSC